jgi:glycosyltransferase involved in cell wall biosynthesis
MKVLSVIPGDGTGSDMIFARNQAESFSGLGHEVSIYYVLERDSMSGVLKSIWGLRQCIKDFSPDVVHSHYGTITALISVCASSVPVVITFRGSDLNPVPSGGGLRTLFAHLFSHLSAFFAAGIICVSAELKQRLVFGRSRAVVIPTGVDTDKFMPLPQSECRSKLGWSPDATVVLFNAGKSPGVKRLDLAEMSIAEAKKILPAIEFVIMRGDVPHDKVPFYLNAADALLITSDYEGSPTILQEAIATGLPVVTVRAGDAVERLHEVVPSQIVSRNPQALASALLDVLKRKERSNGPVVAIKSCSNAVVLPEVANVLASAVGG